jgi:hypothetical protein
MVLTTIQYRQPESGNETDIEERCGLINLLRITMAKFINDSFKSQGQAIVSGELNFQTVELSHQEMFGRLDVIVTIKIFGPSLQHWQAIGTRIQASLINHLRTTLATDAKLNLGFSFEPVFGNWSESLIKGE